MLYIKHSAERQDNNFLDFKKQIYFFPSRIGKTNPCLQKPNILSKKCMGSFNTGGSPGTFQMLDAYLLKDSVSDQGAAYRVCIERKKVGNDG